MCRPWYRVYFAALLLSAVVLVAPASAWASTAFANVELADEGDYWGPVRFTAGSGEMNRLTVRDVWPTIVFHDPGSRVRARGDCKSLDRHTASCLVSHQSLVIKLRDGDDTATLRGYVGAQVLGGAGDDRLTGGAWVEVGVQVQFAGQAGDDVLRGTGDPDWLSGGPGRDRLFGGRGSDTLVDGEADGQAAPDLFNGGPGDGDELDFSSRRRRLRIDLRRTRTRKGDMITDVEKVIGGSGDDRLTGNSAGNELSGGAGDDIVRGGPGPDSVQGDLGSDQVSGGDGNDSVSGGAGIDRLKGGSGSDFLISREVLENSGGTASDEVACGDGFDTARSDASETLHPPCERLWTDRGAVFGTVPMLRDNVAEYAITCVPGGACAGELTVHSLAGDEYGHASFDVPPGGKTTVLVPLSASGVVALRAGTVVQVAVFPSVPIPTLIPTLTPTGYRMFLRLQ